jgi:peptide/nickel transport system permease protein
VSEILPSETLDALTPGGADVRSRRRRQGSLVVGGFLVGLVVLAAALSYVWTPYDPTVVRPDDALAGMGADHLLGADRFGRDVVSQLMVGARTTLLVGMVAIGLAGVIGIPLGAVAAQRGGAVDEVAMRASDIVFAFPAVLLAIMLAAAYGASTLTAMVAIGIAYVPVFARLTRGSALQVLRSDYVLAARAYGRRPLAILLRHVLPNIASVLIVQATVLFSVAILAEAALSYLGLGTPAPTPTWGRMLRDAQTYLDQEAQLALWPGLAIALAVLGFSLLGDGLRDLLDPKLRGRG